MNICTMFKQDDIPFLSVVDKTHYGVTYVKLTTNTWWRQNTAAHI